MAEFNGTVPNHSWESTLRWAGLALSFAVAPNDSSDEAVVTYRVRVGPGAGRGDGVNAVEAVSGTVRSNTALARVQVSGGVFAIEAGIIGKICVIASSCPPAVPHG